VQSGGRDEGGGSLRIRRAERADLDAIIRLYAEDTLGSACEEPGPPLPEAYAAAFREIDGDPSHTLVVAELEGEVVGTFQLTLIPNLTFVGGRRALVEAVHVDARHRGRRIGEAMMRWAIERAHTSGCGLVQLTTNVQRTDAGRFYERLGFVASHVGMKLDLAR
jgi:GNAT superfamily N-acetyltransferase